MVTLLNLKAVDMLAALRRDRVEVDLVIADPPWKFDQRFGASSADDHYECMNYPEILHDFDVVRPLAKRLFVWFSNAHHGPFLWHMAQHDGGWPAPVTGGSWDKGPVKYGQGFHAAGRTEPWSMWALNRADLYTDREVLLETGCREPVQVHSMKPVAYQARMIRKWVPPGGLVVDPYAGFASVAKAVQLAGDGRRYIGAELSPVRYQQALDWLADPTAKTVPWWA